MQSQDLKAFFIDQYKNLEKVGPFRNRAEEVGNKELKIIIELASRWRKMPDSEGKRLVSKILSLYDSKDPLLEVVLKDDAILFETYYQQNIHKLSLLSWLEIACLCGREALVNHFVNTLGNTTSSNLLAYGLSTGDSLFAYRLVLSLKEKNYAHQDCLGLYNKCALTDFNNIKSLIGIQELESSNKMNVS